MRRFFILILPIFLSACGSAPTASDPSVIVGAESPQEEQGYIFGNIQLLKLNQNYTEGAIVTFTHGAVVKLPPGGFLSVKAPRGNIGIAKINIRGSLIDYVLPNLNLKAGPVNSKTYFGHITIAIKPPQPGAIDQSETWNWNVANRWKDGWKEWNESRGADKLKFYAAPAEKIGVDRPITRSIPKDKDQLNTGF